MFDMMDAARLEGLHLAQDPATGLKAIIAIHSTRLGPALGGCRYLPYPNDEAAIGDAIRLAQGMSYKAALAGLEQGGGKAVIIRPPHLDNRGALFEAFGRFIESLGGRYITAVDSGTSSADMDCIAQQTRHVTSTTQAGDPSPHTALGVFAGIRASAQARLGSDDLEGLRVAVQGLGHVGYALAEQLAAVGAELLVCDLDPGRVQLAVEQLGAHPLAPEALLSTPCDILAPCGLGGVLTSQSVSQLRCAAVAGAANNPLERPEVADELEARGILYAPDYVINSGGLIYVALKHRGADPHSITAHLARIPARLTEIYAHAQADHQSPARIADRLAERILYGPQ
ncbi:Leu/Phe/Val dehydrogenase [Pseudomonas aeruginosa]|uniref:Leu/Phe/Val dehydrogenase n=1 Tax=Pseudomonas aeruginosa TaxID=287 RepID=UPI0038C9BF8E|nr:Glu/Leu/Phe/Val dehydrogenase [Pseudomonas aeruginosa]